MIIIELLLVLIQFSLFGNARCWGDGENGEIRYYEDNNPGNCNRLTFNHHYDGSDCDIFTL